MKIFLKFVLCLIVMSVIIFISQKRKISLSVCNGKNIELKYPFNYLGIIDIWSNKTCSISMSYEKNTKLKAKLLLTAFDEPMLLILDDSKKYLYCLYNFDIAKELILFDISSSDEKIPAELSGIIKETFWNVKRADTKDIANFKNLILTKKNKDLKKCSIPSIGLGFYRYYLPKDKILDIINQLK